MNEIVAILTVDGWITNIPAEVAKAAYSGTIARLLSRREMQFMDACDLGIRWHNLATGPTLFLQDANGELHAVTEAPEKVSDAD